MSIEEIKQDFIEFMEEEHGSNPYPRNFFGCLLSIIVEDEPVSQERIMELTGYSQATISLTIQKIQLLMPLRILKIPGDRKNYYSYEGPQMKFLLDMFQRRVDVQDIDLNLVESVLRKVENEPSSRKIDRFRKYLNTLHLLLSSIHTIRGAGLEPFKRFLESGSIEESQLKDSQLIESGKLADFLNTLKSVSYDSALSIDDERVSANFLSLKKEYLSGLKSNLNPLYSQAIANHLMVIHDVFIEGRTTQNRIEKVTKLPRSTISEILAAGERVGQIQVTRATGSKIKQYAPAISITELMLAYFNRVTEYELRIRRRLREFKQATTKLGSRTKATRRFLDFLRELDGVYAFAEKYTRSMNVELVLLLRERYEQGFEFI
ncbi:MAG: hypothetical protein ACFFEJ_05220 [Candidatus Thorarchaeota archaeon]